MNSLGIHIIADLYACNGQLLLRAEVGEKLLESSIRVSGLNLVSISSHQFEPDGYTALALLSESHITIHTWPELSAVLLDIFTCQSDSKAEAAFDYLIARFEPASINKLILSRGSKLNRLNCS